MKGNQSKEIFVSEVIRSNTKDILSFFKYIEKNLQKEKLHLKEVSQRRILLSKKISGKSIYFEFQDTENENFFLLEIFSYKFVLNTTLPKWVQWNFLGLKLGIWLFLVLIGGLLTPLIIYLGFRDNLPEEFQGILLIVGIILMCSGVIASGVLFIANHIRRNRKFRRKSEVEKLSAEISRLIMEYSESTSNKMICWKCFKEISVGLKKCPECGTNI